MKPFISVIVPVYNTREHLQNCLNSLLQQSFNNLEIIIVDDGSPDGAKELILEYHRRYKDTIVPILKENEGPGIARNAGIRLAQGEYVGFVDSDDSVHPDMFAAMYQMAMKKHDFIMCDYALIRKDGRQIRYRGFRGDSFNQEQAVLHSTDTGFSWNKLIRKSLFQHTMFPAGWYEDVGTTPILLTYAASPAYVDKSLYYYQVRSGSITDSNHVATLDILGAWQRLLELANPHYKQQIEFAVAKNIGSFIQFKPQYASYFMDFAIKHRDIFENNPYYQQALAQDKVRNLFA